MLPTLLFDSEGKPIYDLIDTVTGEKLSGELTDHEFNFLVIHDSPTTKEGRAYAEKQKRLTKEQEEQEQRLNEMVKRLQDKGKTEAEIAEALILRGGIRKPSEGQGTPGPGARGVTQRRQR